MIHTKSKKYLIYSVFLFLLVLTLYPVLFLKYFPSMDGAPHMYNANLLLEMMRGNGFIQMFYDYNNSKITNWSDHLLLATLFSFLPAWLSEKILLTVLAAFIPVSMLLIIPKEKRLSSIWLLAFALPFIYNFLFLLGFWNYHIALVMVFIIYGQLYKSDFQIIGKTMLIFLTIMVFLLYFTHALVFGIFCLSYLIIFWFSIIKNQFYKKQNRSLLLRDLIGSSIVFFIPAIFAFRDFINGDKALKISGLEFMPFSEVMKQLFHIRPLIYFNYTTESKVTIWFFFIFLTIFTIIVFNRIKTYKLVRKPFKKSDVFLLISGLLLVIYLFIPNAVKPLVGFLKVRIAVPMFLFFILWIGLQKIKMNFAIPAAIIGLLLHFWLVNYYTKTIKRDFIGNIDELNKISGYIKPNSTVLPVIKHVYWPKNHFSNYLGTDKPMVILENYEASSGSFPLTWNDQMPQLYLGSKALRKSCRFAVEAENPQGRYIIDYIFIYNYKHEKASKCLEEYRNVIQEEYEEVNTGSERHKLLKYKGI